MNKYALVMITIASDVITIVNIKHLFVTMKQTSRLGLQTFNAHLLNVLRISHLTHFLC